MKLLFSAVCFVVICGSLADPTEDRIRQIRRVREFRVGSSSSQHRRSDAGTEDRDSKVGVRTPRGANFKTNYESKVDSVTTPVTPGPPGRSRQIRRVVRTRSRPFDTGVAVSDADRSKRSYDKWLEIISQFARPGANGAASLPWQPFPLELPVGGGNGRPPTSLPLLVLPIPVPVPGRNQECSAGNRGNPTDISPRNSFSDVPQTDLPAIPQRGFSGVSEAPPHMEMDLQTQEQNVDYLIQLYREQLPRAPHLPPAVISTPPKIEHPRIVRATYLPPQGQDATPPQPNFSGRSMMIRGFLTVHTSDYTEAYTAWYDAKNGNSRIDFHDEGTSCYQSSLPDGRVQRFSKHIDRTEEEDKRICGVTEPHSPNGQNLTPPGLPDPKDFKFAGYREEFGGRVEIWKQELRGGEAGELGGALGEALTFHHELLIHRAEDGFSVPLKYSVVIDSSVLGPNCDGYEHIYSECKLSEPNPNKFNFNKDRECDMQEQLDPNDDEHVARLDPLREFTRPDRDPRYGDAFDQFVQKNPRDFIDQKEVVLRKQLFIKNMRRISSCNRQSLSFTTSANFLTDRLDIELRVTFGVDVDQEVPGSSDFLSYSNESIASMAKELEDEFDWRKLGGVTPVKYQGSCSSCWAHAVVGSVEGGWFRKTGKLVELSEQCLVDCGHSHGTKGCNGSWPANAFNYIKDKGIPARNVYTPYKAKVLQCKENEVPKEVFIKGHAKVQPKSIDAMKVAIKKEAPVVVIVDTDQVMVQFQAKGVYHDMRPQLSRKPKLAHAELAVGWGVHRGDVYFILKNSYGEIYAEKGYIRVHAPSNTLYFLERPSVALV